QVHREGKQHESAQSRAEHQAYALAQIVRAAQDGGHGNLLRWVARDFTRRARRRTSPMRAGVRLFGARVTDGLNIACRRGFSRDRRRPPTHHPWLMQYPRPSSLDRKSTRLNSSHVKISYAVFCLKKK